MKIYTGAGDKGTTSLVNGEKVNKSHLRLDCYGSVDELNSYIGLVINHLQPHGFDGIYMFLTKIQNQLFNIGSQLACRDQEMLKKLPGITEQQIKDIEQEIDTLEKDLPPLKEFILPGGSDLACHAHITRTLCRRVERHCCKLAENETIPEVIIPYLNRLSDYFYMLARYFNRALGHQEVTWKK